MEIDSVYKSLDNIDNNVSPSVDNRFNLGSSTRRWATINAVTVNVTDLDLTTIEVTNIDAKDGTAVFTLADTTGAVDANTRNITNVGNFAATTGDFTNVEVSNVKAKDGTASITIADATGNIGLTKQTSLTAGIRFYLDTGVDTYAWQSSDNVVQLVTADVIALQVSLGATTATETNVVCGRASAIATNAADGFLYIPTCAGVPTGTPTAFTGKVAIIFDTTNNKISVYDGAWLQTAALT